MNSSVWFMRVYLYSREGKAEVQAWFSPDNRFMDDGLSYPENYLRDGTMLTWDISSNVQMPERVIQMCIELGETNVKNATKANAKRVPVNLR